MYAARSTLGNSSRTECYGFCCGYSVNAVDFGVAWLSPKEVPRKALWRSSMWSVSHSIRAFIWIDMILLSSPCMAFHIVEIPQGGQWQQTNTMRNKTITESIFRVTRIPCRCHWSHWPRQEWCIPCTKHHSYRISGSRVGYSLHQTPVGSVRWGEHDTSIGFVAWDGHSSLWQPLVLNDCVSGSLHC